MVDAIPSSDREHRLADLVLGRFDAPAHVKRARRVEDAYADLVEACRRERDELVGPVRLRWRAWSAAGGTGLPELAAALGPPTDAVPIPARLLGRARQALAESVRRFNRRWAAHLAAIDLDALNGLRDGYNRYYLLEKECAVRSVVVARQGFRRLPPLTREELAALFPPLPEV